MIVAFSFCNFESRRFLGQTTPPISLGTLNSDTRIYHLPHSCLRASVTVVEHVMNLYSEAADLSFGFEHGTIQL